MSWVVWGLGGGIVLGTVLVWFVFGDEGIKPRAPMIGFVMGGLRASPDMNPLSGLGKTSQLFFAWVQPGNIVANIIAGGVAEAGAQQAGDLMQDVKTGHLIRASPRAQFYGQLIGSCLSIRAYEIPGPSFPAPTAFVWLGLARLLRHGELFEMSGIFIVLFAILFGLVAAAKTYSG
ncbi:hypothetical protein V8D89_003276 [Ganoderma adspersum]